LVFNILNLHLNFFTAVQSYFPLNAKYPLSLEDEWQISMRGTIRFRNEEREAPFFLLAGAV